VKQRMCAARLSVRLVCIVFGSLLAVIARPSEKPPGGADTDAPSLIQRMIGTWDVRQRMWLGAAAEPIDLPPATARRVPIGSTILQETMSLASESTGASFTRVAYFDYNAVNHRYEYFSLDTRAPQMMNERSLAAGPEEKRERPSALTLYGGRFVAPQWGESKNVPFRYRIVIGNVEKEQQTVRLYLTPQSGPNIKEFLAFEYVYTRKS
jgi:hypothetical protein